MVNDPNDHDATFEPRFTCGIKTLRAGRRVQLLLNIISPDPAYQPLLIADEANACDVGVDDGQVMLSRLEFYFRTSLSESALGQPLWELCDTLASMFPDWPNKWPAKLRAGG